MQPSPATDHAPRRARAAKWFAMCVLLVAALFGIAWVTGVLPPEYVPPAAAGVGTALLAAVAVVVLQGPMLRAVDASRLPGMQLQIALGLAFVVKLLALGVGVVAMATAGAKFGSVAAFAISFAATSLVLQVCHAALSTRSSTRVAADPARTEPLH